MATRILQNPGIVRLSLLVAVCLGMTGGTEQQDPFRIDVHVDLVVINATVRDGNGKIVGNLREQDFKVFENGVRQQIRLFKHEDEPVTVGLVIDHSGSMRPKLDSVIAAARSFVQSSRDDDELFVLNFNEKVNLGMPGPVQFNNRLNELAYAISRMPTAGQTALYDATAQAFERLKSAKLDKKALIVISDGGDNASVQSKSAVLKMASQASALVYTIGIFDSDDPDRNPGVLRELAQSTGGEAFFPNALSDVVSICEAIARDIRNQYTLGYVSSNSSAKAYRKIRVTAGSGDASKLTVRARAGYLATQ